MVAERALDVANPDTGIDPGTGFAPRVGALGSTRRPGSAATLARVREMILSGELAPGTVVSQLTLARTLGISPTPLREVVRQLQAEGLMEIELNRRPRVAPLDVDDLFGVYVGRILLESLGVSATVPLMTAETLSGLQKDLREMHRWADKDRPQWAVVHRRFHHRLVVAVPSSIESSINSLQDRSERYHRLLNNPSVARDLRDAEVDHRRIADACSAGDPGAAAGELAQHLAHTALALSAAFAQEADPTAINEAVRMMSSGRGVAH